LYGPFASLGYRAVEGTLYSGARRGLEMEISGAYFRGMKQGRGRMDAYLPVPWTRRHVVHLTGRGHAVLDAPEPLLQVGGWSALAPLYAHPTEAEDIGLQPEENELLPWDVRFGEYLRGFEDAGFLVEKAAIGDVSWRYPIIVDRGVTHFGFLPASFVSQVDLELFASAAMVRPGDELHAAGGGAVDLRLSIFRVPLVVRYQASRRLTDDEAWLQIIALGPDI
jgi:hypothetical protein